MAPIPKLDSLTGNSYAGDTFTQLVQTYNTHTHPQAKSSNFLTYDLTINQTVSFVGISQASADPFAGLGNAIPLTVLEIGAESLRVSRVANATTLATLTTIDLQGDIQTIDNLILTLGSDLVNFSLSTVDRSGLISSDLLTKCLTRYLTTDAQVDRDRTNIPLVLPLAEALTVDLLTDNYTISTYTGSSPTLNLVRGQQYIFTIAAFARAAGGFNLVTQVQDPVYGLKLVTQGVAIDTLANTVTYTVPFDAPSQLFYQGTASPFLYGQINITGGTVNANTNVWQPQQTALAIPTSAPHQQTVLLLSANNDYRLTKFEIYPQWIAPNNPKDAYIQLQYLFNSLVVALSPVLRLQTLDTLRVSTLLSKSIIPKEATVLAALYTPVNLNRLSFQLTTVELTN